MIESSDIVTYLNPEGSSTKFQSDQVLNGIAKAISMSTSTVQAFMSEDYRRMQTTIPGLVLSRYATEGTLTYTIPSWIVTTESSIKLWRNLDYVWRDRLRQDQEEGWSYDDLTFTITLSEEAEAGDSFVCEIIHTSPTPEILKNLCLKLAVGELVNMLPRLVGLEDREIHTNNMNNTNVLLGELRRGLIRINEWDELELLDENETITRMGPGTLRPGW